ncbi:hypothetical protein BDR26DRAFT_900197 [Obelidium mucronatum]|nr:hypothetical protein BDR26DRAFT_900197 [Obelidium mucronatum]
MAKESTEDIVDLRDTYYYKNHSFAYANRTVIAKPIIQSTTTHNNATTALDASKSSRLNLHHQHHQLKHQRKHIVTPNSTNVHNNPQTQLDHALTPNQSFYKDIMRIKSMPIHDSSSALAVLSPLKQTPSVSTVETLEPIDWKRYGKDSKKVEFLKPPIHLRSRYMNPKWIDENGREKVVFGARVEAWKRRPVRTPIQEDEEEDSSSSISSDNDEAFEDVDLKSTLLKVNPSLRNLKTFEKSNQLTIKTKKKIVRYSTDLLPKKPQTSITQSKITLSPRDNLFTPSFQIHHHPRTLSRNTNPNNNNNNLRRTYTAPPPTTFHPFIPPKQKGTGTKITEILANHADHISLLKAKHKPKPKEIIPEIPDEVAYETRPRSAHVAFRLEQHVKPMTMVVEKEPVDDYEKRMRGLFLPSLFAGDGVDDFKGNSARDRSLVKLMNANGGVKGGGGVAGVVGMSRFMMMDRGGKSVGLLEAGAGGIATAGGGESSTVGAVVAAGGKPLTPPIPTPTPGGGGKLKTPEQDFIKRKPGTGPTAAVAAAAATKPEPTRKTNSARIRSAKNRKLSTALHKTPQKTISPAKGRKSLATMNDADGDIPDDMNISTVRWSLAIYSVLKQIRIKKSVLEDSIRGEDDSAMGKLLRAKQDKLDLIGAAQVKRFYEINLGSRTDKDLDMLDSIVGKYQCFSKLSPVVRYKLYNCCTLESHPRGRVMIREGHQARFWYILLTGECLNILRPDTPMSITTRVRTGGSVGEFQAVFGASTAELRHARATCLMRCDFLRVEKQDFLAISREARGLDTMVFEYFTTVPSFFGVEKAVLTLICQRSIVRKFEAKQVMLRAGELCSNLYFIMKGKVRALHMVTFAKVDCGVSSTNTSDRRHKYTLVPYGLNPIAKLGPNDEIVRELATVLDLGGGMSFPPIKPSKVVQEQQEAMDRAEAAAGIPLSARRSSMKPAVGADANALPCPFHFVVVDRLEVVVISIQDLKEILPPDTLRRVMEHRSLTDVGSQEIEERYMSALGWRDTESSGSRTLRIDSFSKDGSWSNPVVKNKFKDNVDVDPFGIGQKEKSEGNLNSPQDAMQRRQKSMAELMIEG